MTSQSYDKMPLAELKKVLEELKVEAKEKIINKIKKIKMGEEGKYSFVSKYIFYSAKDYKILKYINDNIDFMMELDGNKIEYLMKGERKIELNDEGDLIKKVFKLLNKKIKVKESEPYGVERIDVLFPRMSYLYLTAHENLAKEFFVRIEVTRFGENSKCGRKNKGLKE